MISKKRAVGVVGLGYVGLPLASLFAEKGFRVVGYDINDSKIFELKRGFDSMKQVEKIPKGISFTTDPKDLASCEMVFVCVPTSLRDGEIDTRAIKAATRTLATILVSETKIVYESSVYTGLTRELMKLLKKTAPKKSFHVGYSPERVNPGDKVHTTAKITKLVAGDTPETAKAIAEFYGKVLDADVHVCPSLEVAETAKIYENIQRASLIALANELAIYCHGLGMKTEDVLQACRTKWNFVPVTPGIVAGDCLPVNPVYFLHQSTAPMDVVEAVVSRNGGFIDFLVETIQEKVRGLEKKSVGIFGVSYKEDIGDVRMSGALPLAEGLGAMTTHLVDPNVIAEHFSGQLTSIEDIDDGTLDIAIILIGHKAFRQNSEQLIRKVRPKGWIFDLKGVISSVPQGLNLWRL